MYRVTLNFYVPKLMLILQQFFCLIFRVLGLQTNTTTLGLKWILSLTELESAVMDLIMLFVSLIVSLQSRDRIGTGGQVVDCSRLFDNDLPDG